MHRSIKKDLLILDSPLREEQYICFNGMPICRSTQVSDTTTRIPDRSLIVRRSIPCNRRRRHLQQNLEPIYLMQSCCFRDNRGYPGRLFSHQRTFILQNEVGPYEEAPTREDNLIPNIRNILPEHIPIDIELCSDFCPCRTS